MMVLNPHLRHNLQQNFQSLSRRLHHHLVCENLIPPWPLFPAPKEGCDRPVLLEDTKEFKGEQTASLNNNSLRGFDVINRIKTMVKSSCEGIVSCTDVLAVAARDAIMMVNEKITTT
ncbi:hypothetical protein LguiB_032327 [Lonicera macranthoides]